ncbi:MAG: SDR family oxidoreductase [Ilumatobacter sp.]|nr:SDR family oxidoreductase [bacterium]MDG1265409.1 SDR family oxidoreductase [Ilumatobacter sp.]MDG2040833.1 SDR family oxidoreductase [Ilumatobacter sp.]NKB40979.1 SDR family oxidoreductase [Ilumatobacter sp.]
MSDITSDRLDGRVALVTGSTRGIGSAIAERLAAAGATVIVHGRSTDRCAEVAAQIPGALPVAFDLTSADAGDRLVAAVVAKANRLDIVVNNAGVALDNFITGVTNDRWADTLTANLTAPFAIIRAAARVFKIQANGGAIVNLTSTSGERGNPGQAAYAASKGGLHAVTQTAARELGRFAVRVNSISPLAATEMNGLIDEDRREVVAKALPLGMVADPSQIAEAVAFLVSDRAAYITGELMHVDAGFHLT